MQADREKALPMREALESIIARLEAATGPDRELDEDIMLALGLCRRHPDPLYLDQWIKDMPDGSTHGGNSSVIIERVTESIDAARRVLRTKFPRACISINEWEDKARCAFAAHRPEYGFDQLTAEGYHAKTPIALCLALCRALLAQQIETETAHG